VSLSIKSTPVSQITSRFCFAAYCYKCGSSVQVDERKYQHCSIDEVKEAVICPKCGCQGLSLSVVLKPAAKDNLLKNHSV